MIHVLNLASAKQITNILVFNFFTLSARNLSSSCNTMSSHHWFVRLATAFDDKSVSSYQRTLLQVGFQNLSSAGLLQVVSTNLQMTSYNKPDFKQTHCNSMELTTKR